MEGRRWDGSEIEHPPRIQSLPAYPFTNLPLTIALARRYCSFFATIGLPNRYTFCTRPCAPLFASSRKHEKITREPSEKPTSVIGRTPRLRSIRESARMRPAASARSRETLQGLSSRYESLVRTIGRVREAMRAVRMVLARTCWRP